MSADHPVLVFVAGPQAGQRVLLNRPVLVLGRGGGSDIMLSEDFASREQARYELLQAGPALEGLSQRGTWVNGKRYKSGKKILLATGDLIGVGQETEILFVAAGDDGDAVLAAYEAAAGTRKNAFGKRPRPREQEPAPAPAEEALQAAPAEPPPRAGKARPRRPSEMTAGQRSQAEESARKRKIAIGLGIYLGIMLLALLLGLVFLRRPSAEVKTPPQLTDQELADALAEIPEKTPRRLFMEQRLEEARGLYQQYGLESPHLYRCVHAFKQALAYSGRSFFESTEDEKMYRAALARLTEKIRNMYRNAYLYEQSKDWTRAEAAFRNLLAMLAVEDEVETGRLFANIQAHHKRVKYYLQLKKPRKRGPWM